MLTPELVLVSPELLAEAQQRQTQRKAAMSSSEPANGTFFVDPAQAVPPPATPEVALPPAPAPELVTAPAPTAAPAAAQPQETQTAPMIDVPLGTLIFRAGLLAEEQLEDALQEGMRTGKRLGEVLIERGWLRERDLGRLLAGQKGLPFVEISASDAEPTALQALPEEKAKLQVALPLRHEDGELVVAVADPSNELMLENLRRALGAEPKLVVAPYADLVRSIGEAYGGPPVEAPAPPEPVAAQPVLAQPEMQSPVVQPAPLPEAMLAPPVQTQPETQLVPPVEPEPVAEPLPPLTPPAVTPLPTVLPPAEERAPEPAPAPVVPPTTEPPPAAVQETPPVEAPVVPAIETVPPLHAQTPPAPEPVAQPPVVAPEPVVPAVQPPPAPEPVLQTPVPAPPAVEPPAPPAPPVESPAPVAPVQAEPGSVIVVVLRLRDGETLEIGTFPTSAEAGAHAKEIVAEIAAAEGNAMWPFFAQRYLRPDSIVSVDLVEENADRWLGSSVRRSWAGDQ